MVRSRKSPAEELADKLFPLRQPTDDWELLNIPPEQRRLHTEIYDFTVATMIDYLDNEHLFLPEFQRGYVWSRAQASRLIESLVIQCPIPVLYLSQTQEERLAVIDGNQRLSTINLYLKDGFALKELRAYPELENYRFSDLDPRFQRHIKNRTLRCIVILKETHPQIKFDVFQRLNTGAVQLNPQELRHGISYGRLIKTIDELADLPEWKAITGIYNDKRMKSSELILRFFALSYSITKYSKPLVAFLNKFAEEHKNVNEETLIEWSNNFKSTTYAVMEYLGEYAFRIIGRELQHTRSINSALFDAQMIGFSRVRPPSPLRSRRKRQAFVQAVSSLFEEEQFKRSISASTSDETQVKYRIERFEAFLREFM